MNVLCLGYYDKHSRFFIGIKKWLIKSNRSPISFSYYNIHISGFLYTFLRFKKCSFLPLKAWFKVYLNKGYYKQIIESKVTYKGLNYASFINFHLRLQHKVSRQDLLLQALAYIDIFEKALTKSNPDVLLTIGDSRLCAEIAVAMAKQKGITVYFIEQGPFNTTFFDNNGSNANMSIRRGVEVISQSECELQNTTTTSNKYFRSPIYRGIDIALMTILERTKLYPPDLKYTDINTYKRRIERSTAKTEIIPSNHLLFAMQVPFDVNMIYHSPHYESHLQIIKDLYNHKPPELDLVVREHPLYKGKYGKDVYEFINSKGILIDNSSRLDNAINKASIIVVNNSTVGIEAIAKYKPVVVLGNSFYDNENICLKLTTKEKLSSLLKTALNTNTNKEKIDCFMQKLYATIMIKGSIADKRLVASKHIANHLNINH